MLRMSNCMLLIVYDSYQVTNEQWYNSHNAVDGQPHGFHVYTNDHSYAEREPSEEALDLSIGRSILNDGDLGDYNMEPSQEIDFLNGWVENEARNMFG